MQYELLDSGNQNKLERFGKYVLARPCLQAVWRPVLTQFLWEKADGVFTRDPHNQWTTRPFVPNFLQSSWIFEFQDIVLKLMPTEFGHIGVFPEHAFLWKWMRNKICPGASLLNLFAYTGGASIIGAKAGARVCHVDASKAAVAWARENASLNGVENVRWIVDDVIKFLSREVRRGVCYDGIILDPPTFGRGSHGEVFKIENDLPTILNLCFKLLSQKPLFVILSSHTPGYTPIVLRHLLRQAADLGVIETGEMVIQAPLELPSGSYGRWYV
jgi:23S rRNA (cytosine1962-C5)-methyltransferase